MKNGRYEENGDVFWYKNDLFHREDGPAIEWADGGKHWYVNGLLHRLDGPAVEWANGAKFWYANGALHRLDGPAIEWSSDNKNWFVDGQVVEIKTIFGYEPSHPLTDEQQMVLRLNV